MGSYVSCLQVYETGKTYTIIRPLGTTMEVVDLNLPYID